MIIGSDHEREGAKGRTESGKRHGQWHEIACGEVTNINRETELPDDYLPIRRRSDPARVSDYQSRHFFGCIFKPKLMVELTSPANLPENGMHMEKVGVDVVATGRPAGTGREQLVSYARERGMHLLVARMRPRHARDTVFELVFSEGRFNTLIEDLVLYTQGCSRWFLCPARGDMLYFNLSRTGIEPQASPPWVSRQERVAGFRDAGTLLAGAVGE